MKKTMGFFWSFLLLLLISIPDISLALESKALQQMLEQGDQITVIDIRSRERYKSGHIPGAINISANIIGRKKLPPVGKVIVCGDGVRNDITLQAVAALNQKRGIEADFLQGGFAAWSSLSLPETQRQGVAKQELQYITYQELQRALQGNHNLVLVDIRRFRRKDAQLRQTDKATKMSNLAVCFPGVKIITPAAEPSPFANNTQKIQLSSFLQDQNTVYVIIDRGDGKAEDVARRLNGASIKQNIILLGGETILKREGEAGSSEELEK